MYIQEADSWTVDIPENILILRKYAPKKGKVKGLIPSDIHRFTLQHVCVCVCVHALACVQVHMQRPSKQNQEQPLSASTNNKANGANCQNCGSPGKGDMVVLCSVFVFLM